MKNYTIGIISGEKLIEFREQELRRPTGRQVLIRVDSCAVCTLEQRIYQGIMKPYPFAGGHEMSGIIEETGDEVKNLSVGDKAALRMYTACGECLNCRSGHENQCVEAYKTRVHEGFNGPGGFAQYMLVEAKHVYRMPKEVNLEHAALTEPLACCVHSIGKADIRLGENVVIIGAGIMGLLHIQLARLRGARVIVCEIDEPRIKKAEEAGAHVVINSKNEDAVGKVKKLTGNCGADAVFCTAALPGAAESSVSMAGKFGRVIFYSSIHPNVPISLNPNLIHSNETVLTGSVNPDMRDFLAAVRLLSGGLVDVSALISEVIPLSDLQRALERAIDPSSYRIIVKCS